MDYIITANGNLTSFVFYNEVIAQLHSYFAEGNQSHIMFDFSHIKRIDPLVLPNLLCAGYWISQHRGAPAKIFIPGNLEFAPLRTFLNRTRFVEISQTYGLFEFDECISGGLKETVFSDTLNRLELFQIEDMDTDNSAGENAQKIDVDATRLEAWSKLKKAFIPFINEFLQKSTDQYIVTHRKEIASALLSFCRELIENALLHGRSFCFLNMQYSSTFGQQMKISISDCGMGFKRSINADRKRSQHILALEKQYKERTGQEREHLGIEIGQLLRQCYPLRHTPPEHDDVHRLDDYPYMDSELKGIVYGLLSRRSKPYGLYNIHHRIIHKMGGTIRIHSNDTQLILSRRMWAPLEVCKTPEALLEQLSNPQYAANVRTDLTFKGTHIEIELMLDGHEEDCI